MLTAVGIDWSDAERVMKNLQAAEDQFPFAMALALTEATKKTREYLITETWSEKHGIKRRNQSFIGAALIHRGTLANKRQLSTEIYENPRLQGRGNLMLHAKGGTRRPQGHAYLAIPTSNLPRGQSGVPKNLRPKAIQGRAVQKGDALYMRDRRTGRLKMLYVLKTATPIPKRVPFFEDYKEVMGRELMKAFPAAVERAMRTRRAR